MAYFNSVGGTRSTSGAALGHRRAIGGEKFEISGDAVEALLDPYQDDSQEKMLGEMPIETRRELEAEAERRRREDEQQ